MSQVNNVTYLSKIRPKPWFQDNAVSKYLTDIELFSKQVYENLTGVTRLRSFTVANLPTASDFDPADGGAAFVFVSDETGGAVTAFSDGTNWLRTTDRAIVS